MIGLSEYKYTQNWYLGQDLTWISSNCKNITGQFVLPINLSIFDKRFTIQNSQARGIEKP